MVSFRRYVDQMKFFPRGQSVLGEIFSFMIDFILNKKGHVLSSFDRPYLTEDNIEILCESIAANGSPYKRCFGFIESVCRPTTDQREVAS